MAISDPSLKSAVFYFCILGILRESHTVKHRRPNFILIVADDMGYGDLSSYGHPTQEWNVLDKMASEGLRFTQMYSPAVFCTPSRAALLTGRLPTRLGMRGDIPVFLPTHSTGLPKDEVTIAELLQQHGYHTGIVGKWHLGINEFHFNDGRHLPQNHGFEYVGTILPFSLETVCDQTGRHIPKPKCKRCFLYRNTTIIQQPLSLDRLTASIVMDVRDFLYTHAETLEQEDREWPFFLFLSLPQTHTPMFNDPRFKGKSIRGDYGDQILEMSWAVNETLNVLSDLGIERNTMVAFISDHGPHREMCAEGGSSGPFRGGKGNYLEGGLRIPAIAWWPGTIPSGRVTSSPVSHMDLYATFADLAKISLTPNLATDSKSLKPLLLHDPNVEIHDIMFFYCQDIIMAVRYKEFKIHFYTQKVIQPDEYKLHCRNGVSCCDFYVDLSCTGRSPLDNPVMYDLNRDPGETFPLQLEDHRDVLQIVRCLKNQHLESMVIPQQPLLDLSYSSDSLIPCCNPPYCVCNYSPLV